MLKLNKKIEYALISLQHIANKKGLVSAKDISLTYLLPFDATAKVLQILAQNKWLVSEQGPSGGYRIGPSGLQDLSLYDLVKMIEGEHAVVKCLIKKSECPILDKCNLMSPMEQLNQNLREFLQQQKVLSLLGKKQVLQEVQYVRN